MTDADLHGAWETAARELGFAAVVPFVLTVDDRTHECIAWLPDVGGPRGILVVGVSPPDFRVDPAFVEDAERLGYAWSGVATSSYGTFERALFVETLADWGFHGPADARPDGLE